MDLIREFFLDAFPNPDRAGCPDEETLMALAEGRLPAENPACLHVGSCSECFAEFTGCVLELEARENGDVISDVAKTDHKAMNWTGIASSLGKRETAANALQRLGERIAEYRHRGENQELKKQL
jgi:hypothetical protein